MRSDVSDGKLEKSRFWAALGLEPSCLTMMALVLGGLLPITTSAMPVDPQRPFDAVNCEDAKARLYEALMGNSLVSAEEMAEVLAIAHDGTERLCGPDITQRIMTDFNTKEIENSR